MRSGPVLRKCFGLLFLMLVVGTVQFGQSRATAEPYSPPANSRIEYNLNIDWKFYQGDVADAEKVDFNDSAWTTVSLPHTFNDVDSYDQVIGNSTSGEPSAYWGITWYRKHFRLDSALAGKRVFIEFEGIRQAASVWVNGQYAGIYEAGVTPFGFDISNYANFGSAENIIAVKADNSNNYVESTTGVAFQWQSRDFNENFGGLTRNVLLYVMDNVHMTLPLWCNLGTTGNYIYPSNISTDNRTATINVESQIKNDGATPRNVTLEATVVDKDGNGVLTFTGDTYTIQPGETYTLKGQGELTDAKFWQPDYPYLYTVYCSLKEGSTYVDVDPITTGFRKVEFKGGATAGGVYVNNQQMFFPGYAQRSVNDWAGLGAAIPDWMHDYDAKLIREGNGTFVRWMHISAEPVDIRACDAYGIVAQQPFGDKESDATGRQWEQRMEVAEASIIYFRNNPSILFWEAGNNWITADHMSQMYDLKHKWDPHGMRAIGCRAISEDPAYGGPAAVAKCEFIGTMLNRHVTRYVADRVPVTETEYTREEAPRRVWDDYSPPDFDYKFGNPGTPPTYDLTSEQFATTTAIPNFMEFWKGRIQGPGDNYYSACAALHWSDLDSHARQFYTENCRVSGRVDAVRLPKESFYTYRVMQNPNPDIHIVGHWTYPAGTRKTMYVIANHVAKVELFINDVSLGSKTIPDLPDFGYSFTNVTWQAGTIKAVGYDAAGNVLCQDLIETAGAPDHLKLTTITSPAGLLANGEDIAMIDVEVVDANGRRCPTDQDRIDFAITGEGKFEGGWNSGKSGSVHKSYVDTECGINRVFIRATRAGLPSATITITSQPIAPVVDGLTTQMPVRMLPALSATLPTYGPDPAAITSVDPINVTTTIGTAPVLPSVAKVTYADGKSANVTVTWNDIDPAQYGQAENFTVQGVITTTTTPVTANVTVAGITSITPIKQTVRIGEAPDLPSQVQVIYSNNATATVPVVWDSIDPSQYAQGGSFTVNGTVHYTTIKAEAIINVASFLIQGLKFDKSSMSIVIGSTKTLIPIFTPFDADEKGLTWSSSDQNVVTVDQNGNVKGIALGTAVITATANDTRNGIFTATCTVQVVSEAVPATAIALDCTSYNFVSDYFSTTNQEANPPVKQIGASFTPENATPLDIVWSSDNPAVATVDQYGVVTALKPGVAHIKAATQDGGLTATGTVNVPRVSESFENRDDGTAGTTTDTWGITKGSTNGTISGAVTTLTDIGKVFRLSGSGTGDRGAYKPFSPVIANNLILLDFDWNIGAPANSNGAQLRIQDSAHYNYITFEVSNQATNPILYGTYPTIARYGTLAALGGTSLGADFNTANTTYNVKVTLDMASKLISFTFTDKADSSRTTSVTDIPFDNTVSYNNNLGYLDFYVTRSSSGTMSWTPWLDNFNVYGLAQAPGSVLLDQTELYLNSTPGDPLQTAQLMATVYPTSFEQTVTWNSSDPSIATVDSSGLVTAVAEAEGVATITATSTLDSSVSASCQVAVTANHAPVLSAIPDQTVGTNEKLEFRVSATDQENDVIVYSVSGLPAGATFDPEHLIFSWTPTKEQVGTYTVHFQVRDESISSGQDVTITVNPVNHAPVFDAISDKSGKEGQLLQFTVNAIDADGDSLTYSASNLPDGASFDPATRLFSWTPSVGQAGTYTVTFAVNDGNLSASEDVTITVANANTAPVFDSIADKSVNEGELLQFTVNATDAEGDPLTYSASGLPAGASFDATTKTFNWTPSLSQVGSYTVHFEASDGQLSSSKEVVITVAATVTDSATLISEDIPDAMIAGNTYTVHLAVKNTGTSTWTDADGYELGAVNHSDPFAASRQALSANESVASGQVKSFTITMKAPSMPGRYTTDWQMVHGSQWIGTAALVTKAVTVTKDDDATYVNDDIPTTMVAGQSYTVHITVTNNGGTTWTAADRYKLGAVGETDPFAASRIHLGAADSIAPGASKTFSFTMKAPAAAGTYTTDWRMIQERTSWFGPVLVSKAVIVNAGSGATAVTESSAPSASSRITRISLVEPKALIEDEKSAEIVNTTIPPVMIAGQSYPVSVTVKNTSDDTWTNAQGFKLIPLADSGLFAPAQELEGTDAIAPGQEKTFTFTVIAPALTGTYNADWQMGQEGISWLGSKLTMDIEVKQ